MIYFFFFLLPIYDWILIKVLSQNEDEERKKKNSYSDPQIGYHAHNQNRRAQELDQREKKEAFMHQEERKLYAVSFYCFDCDKNVCVKKRKYSFRNEIPIQTFPQTIFRCAISNSDAVARNKWRTIAPPLTKRVFHQTRILNIINRNRSHNDACRTREGERACGIETPCVRWRTD